MTDGPKLLTKASLAILIGYMGLTIITVVLILYLDWARDLFDSTQIIVHINAVWFGLGIAAYGAFALMKNRRRAILSNLDIKLDTQFMIVSAFFFFALAQIFDLLIYMQEPTGDKLLAMESGSKVLTFGGFMAGLASIYFGRKRQ